MAPHLSPAEQDLAFSGLAAGKTASQMFAMVAKKRFARRNVLAMDTARRRFIKDTRGTRQATWDLVRSKAWAPWAAHSPPIARP